MKSRAPLPTPVTQVPNLEWRELRVEDATALTAILNRIEEHDQDPYRTSLEEVHDLLSTTGRVSLVGGLIGTDLRCYGLVRIRPSTPHVAICQGGVDPLVRGKGIGGELVAWQTGQAQRMLTDSSDPRRHITFHVEEGRSELEAHLRALNYRWLRTAYDLRSPLTDVPEQVQIPAFLEIVPWEEVDEEDILEVANTLYRDQPGAEPVSLDVWLAGRAHFHPQWSFVALDRSGDRPRAAGFVMASKYQQDWSVLGWREGTIDMLGVLPDYRGQEVATALLATSMRAQAQAGMEATGASLLSDNHSHAVSVYDAVGFTIAATTRIYVLESW